VAKYIQPNCIVNHNHNEIVITCKHRLFETLRASAQQLNSDHSSLMPRQYVVNVSENDTLNTDESRYMEHDFLKTYAESVIKSYKEGNTLT
jgi:hypothetical protein